MEALSEVIFERTLSGASAVKLPKDQLPRHLRTLLLAVDGRLPVSSFAPFLTTLAPLSEKFAELERLGFLKRKGGSPPIADPNCQAAQDTSGPTAISIEARLSDIKPWSIVEIESVSLTNKRPEAPISPVDTSFELELQAYALEIARLSPR